MKQRIQNTLIIECEDIDLTKCRDTEVYIRQGYRTKTYTPEVISGTEMLVVVPYDDAMELSKGMVLVQFATTDENGTPRASEIETANVGELIKEEGYDGKR